MAQTKLHDLFLNTPGVKMTQFGEYELPLHFSLGIQKEHHVVRNGVGLFDVSHMGRCIISGEKATEHLDYLLTNSVETMRERQLIYSLMCYPDGGVVDDVILYRLSSDSYYIVLNSANVEKDIAWITKDNPQGFDSEHLQFTNVSSTTSQFALQGPLAQSLLEAMNLELSNLKFFHFIPSVKVDDIELMISRNGYTGEDGFEIYVENGKAEELYTKLLQYGEEFSLSPCGLGSRDTLRLEAKLPLYGHEISSSITPLEANLGVFVKFDKGPFCGKEALVTQKGEGIPRSLRGFEMVDPSVPRHGYPIFLQGERIGFVTSGIKSPTLGIFCGFMLIERDRKLSFGDIVEIEIHGKMKKAKLVRTPFYKRGDEKR
jgi:aminomethyltransferase